MDAYITNMRDQTYRVGQRVRHHLDGWEGEVTAITESGLLRVKPDRESEVAPHMRWKLNPVAAVRAGRVTYCRPRDQGLAMGCFDPLD